MKRILPYLFTLISLLSTLSFAQQQTSVVLYPVQVDEVENQFADPYGSALQEGLRSRYKVYYGPAVEQFLKKEYQKIDCSAETCSQNVAIQFNTSLVADAAVQKTSEGYIITFKITDVLTNEIVESKTVPCKDCGNFQVIDQFKIIGFGDAKLEAAVVGVAPQQSVKAPVKKTTGYTKIGAKGEELDVGVTHWACVLDNKTGLMWENKQLSGLHGMEDKYNFGDAFEGDDSFVSKVNETKLCGYEDWSGPEKNELLSILDIVEKDPAINSSYFPNTVSNNFWTTSLFTNYRTSAWIVNFGGG